MRDIHAARVHKWGYRNFNDAVKKETIVRQSNELKSYAIDGKNFD